MDYKNLNTNVDWNNRIFWEVSGEHDELQNLFNIDVNRFIDKSKVDIKNDVLIFKSYDVLTEISEEIFSLLESGIKFIFNCLWEKESDHFDILKPYVSNGIALVSGTSYSIEGWPDNKLIFIPMSFWYIEFMRMNFIPDISLNFKRNIRPHEFLMPVKRRRPHRELFVKLLGNNLHRGLYSIAWDNIVLPGQVSGDELNKYEWAWEEDRFYDPSWYRSTYYSVVVETSSTGSIFLTEKTFKPIMYGHPFIIFGARHSLKTLRDFGFETFPELFDESYDDEANEVKRAEMIVNEISNFRLEKRYNENKHIIDNKIQHNFNRFYNANFLLEAINDNLAQKIGNFINGK